jgi:tetratricopeptide (TPR) repeat protein
MAHWGVAISLWHQLWSRPDPKTIAQGLTEVKKAKSLRPNTDRERDYIAAMYMFYSDSKKRDHQARATAYSNAMEQMYQHYPDDREAAAFYALSLLASEPEHDTTFANRKKGAAVLEKLFAEEPGHPGVAHYLIHSYDKPQLAELGLPAARRYAQIAPASPHALHMPSHIFARLGLWQDDIDSNVASISATRKTAAMHMGGAGHQFHAMDFLVYAYVQSGREADAMKVIDEVKAMPAMQDHENVGYDERAYALSEFPAVYTLELHHWAEAAALTPVSGAEPADHAITYWARAIGAIHSGNLEQARKDIQELQSIHKTLADGRKAFLADLVGDAAKEAQAWMDFAEGKRDAALTAMRGFAEKEEAEGSEPGTLPAREMLADMLLEMKRPEQALAEYEMDLKFNPNRFNGLYGAAHAAEMAGKTQEANTYYVRLVKTCGGSNSDRPELAYARSLLAQK